MKKNNTCDLADLYVRVSTAEQANEGYSVGEQEDRLRHYCSAMQIPVHAVRIDPGFSGASMDRPGLQAVIEDAKARRIGRVIVWKLDRLSRSQKDTLILLEDVFLKNGVDFVSMQESFDTSTPFGRAIVGILAAFAQLERENIKERTMMGRKAAVRDSGHFLGAVAPFGYKRSGAVLAVDEFQAMMVREIFDRFVAGESYTSITKVLNEKFPGQAPATVPTVRRILANPTYIGKVRFDGGEFAGAQDPIISPELFSAAAERAAAISKSRPDGVGPVRGKTSNSHKYLLTGMLFCGVCGCRMCAKSSHKRGHLYQYYMCESHVRSTASRPKCSNGFYKMRDVDDLVKNEILKLSFDPDVIRGLLADRPADVDKSRETLTRRLAEIDRQQERLIALFQVDGIAIDVVAARSADLRAERASIVDQLQALGSAPEKDQDDISRLAAPAQAVFASGDPVASWQVVDSLIEKVVVSDDEIKIFWNFV